MGRTLIVVSCEKRSVVKMLDVLGKEIDKIGIGSKVLLYGITPKEHRGYAIVACSDFPASVIEAMKKSPKIIEVVACDLEIDMEQEGRITEEVQEVAKGISVEEMRGVIERALGNGQAE